ncbi:hypothetical protein PR202_ga07904 [Eleusine coracana subsp. coracana]|uniref:Haloacid dehalogenase-like hydrolase domain-containing protein Sgpp n=1 Tax=Eleusine coracana subsp. coracana TaxID=191504 RepID=A0AAV5C181_ELECO|nr:hypothetical protein PR202_ga07904 [Eleusine coracana subsp. coracana]
MLASPRASASRARGLHSYISAPSSRIISNNNRIRARGEEDTTTKNRSFISWTMSSEATGPASNGRSGIALSKQAPLEAILFDIDGTLCDSDPIHFLAFRELLQQVCFNDGVPITEEFFSANISGGHNDDLARVLFPDMDFEKAMKFMDDKEAFFRKLAAEQLKAVDGLHDLCRWIEARNLKRAAVTNAPRANAEMMLSLLGLTDFFPVLVIERVRPGQAVP